MTEYLRDVQESEVSVAVGQERDPKTRGITDLDKRGSSKISLKSMPSVWNRIFVLSDCRDSNRTLYPTCVRVQQREEGDRSSKSLEKNSLDRRGRNRLLRRPSARG